MNGKGVKMAQLDLCSTPKFYLTGLALPWQGQPGVGGKLGQRLQFLLAPSGSSQGRLSAGLDLGLIFKCEQLQG